MNVKQILATKGKGVVTITPTETIEAAILKMKQHNIGSLVVVDEAGQMVGILTERHIVRQAPQLGEFLTKPVAELMEPNVITGTPHDDLQHHDQKTHPPLAHLRSWQIVWPYLGR